MKEEKDGAISADKKASLQEHAGNWWFPIKSQTTYTCKIYDDWCTRCLTTYEFCV